MLQSDKYYYLPRKLEVLTDFNNRVDLDCDVVRQGTDTKRGARMTARFSEDFDEQIGCAVDDLRVEKEVRGGVHKSADIHKSNEPVHIAIDSGVHLGDHVQSAKASRLLTVFDLELTAEFTDEAPLAIPLRNLAGDEDEVPRSNKRDVSKLRGCQLGQFQP